MKALVTGGCGFIGHNLTLRLRKLEWKVHVIDNLSSGSKDNKVGGATYWYDSITDQEIVNDIVRTLQPDVVFHVAAMPRVTYSVEHPLETTVNNVVGTVSVLDAVRKYAPKCRIVASSSSSVYGGADEMPTREKCESRPQSPYAMQKLQLEEWCHMYAHLYDMDICSLRYFNVFGPYSLFGGAYSTVLSAWMYHLFVNPEPPAFLEGDGEQTRDFCYVDNVVDANMLAATCKTRLKGHVFNIAQGNAHSLWYVKELLERISRRRLHLDMRPERVGDVKHTLADISHAQRILGYNPTTNFDDQVEIMANWYRDSYPKGDK